MGYEVVSVVCNRCDRQFDPHSIEWASASEPYSSGETGPGVRSICRGCQESFEEPDGSILVEAPGAKAKFEEFLGRGDSIGVYQNKDMSNSLCGHKLFIPLDADDLGRVEIGKTHGPDGSWGLGWRYKLVAIVKNIGPFRFVEEA